MLLCGAMHLHNICHCGVRCTDSCSKCSPAYLCRLKLWSIAVLLLVHDKSSVCGCISLYMFQLHAS